MTHIVEWHILCLLVLNKNSKSSYAAQHVYTNIHRGAIFIEDQTTYV
jgi:hypothetical protein